MRFVVPEVSEKYRGNAPRHEYFDNKTASAIGVKIHFNRTFLSPDVGDEVLDCNNLLAHHVLENRQEWIDENEILPLGTSLSEQILPRAKLKLD